MPNDLQPFIDRRWDEELLGLELGELEVLGFDLDLIGFSEAERIALLAQGTEGLTDPDEVPVG